VAQQRARLQADHFVERPPQYGNEATISTDVIDFKNWRGFFVFIFNNSAKDVTLLPPIVSLGTIDDGPPPTINVREVPLPGLPQQKRVITVLDGISPASPGLNSVTLRVRRPAVEFATFERWINWDLTDKAVKESLDGAFALGKDQSNTE
jgi:hypothetical protein